MENFKRLILDESIRIGDALLNSKIVSEAGYCWASRDEDQERLSENIYSGACGIVLFFRELYAQTRAEKYKDAAVQGMRWVEDRIQKQDTASYTFLSGRLGVAYTMLKLSELTGLNDYRDKALQIAEGSSVLKKQPGVLHEFLNGTSGSILSLLHVYAGTGKASLLGIINDLTEQLIQSVHIGPEGVFWDRDGMQIRGLCGFSHGASGPGFLFLELGHFFNNEAFYWLAEQAFLYESGWYQEETASWPDLRMLNSNSGTYEQLKKSVFENRAEAYTTPGYMSAWCHGAPGIGLARLRAFELLRNEVNKEEAGKAIADARKALEKVTEKTTYTLCHGLGGNAALFLEAYRVLGKGEYMELAHEIAAAALDGGKKGYLSGRPNGGTQDPGLFTGNAGIGMLYLSLLDPSQSLSILAPRLDSSLSDLSVLESHAVLTIGKAALKRKLLAKVFGRTIAVLERVDEEYLRSFFVNELPDRSDLTNMFIKFVQERLSRLPPQEKTVLQDIFTLELTKLTIDTGIPSYFYIYIQQEDLLSRSQELLNRTLEEFLTLRLCKDPYAVLHETKWNWSNGLEHIENPASYVSLLKPTLKGVLEEPLPMLAVAVLNAFEESRPVEEALAEVLEMIDAGSEKERASFADMILAQIRHAVYQGILVENEQGTRLGSGE